MFTESDVRKVYFESKKRLTKKVGLDVQQAIKIVRDIRCDSKDKDLIVSSSERFCSTMGPLQNLTSDKLHRLNSSIRTLEAQTNDVYAIISRFNDLKEQINQIQFR